MLFTTHLKLTAMETAVPFIPAAIAIPTAPLYLFTGSEFWITVGFGLHGACGGALCSQLPSGA